jgi:hypothetical protein
MNVVKKVLCCTGTCHFNTFDVNHDEATNSLLKRLVVVNLLGANKDVVVIELQFMVFLKSFLAVGKELDFTALCGTSSQLS